MSNTWGSQTWGFNQWNELNNVSVSVTGIPISTNIRPLPVAFTAVADAQISTDENKFGGSSLKLDGSSDRIQSGDITLGTSDYTWETFAYFNSFASNQCIWDAGENVGASQNPVVFITSTNIQISYAGGTYINVAHGMSVDTWHHIAIVRNGTGTGNLKAYIDGVNVGTGNLGSVGAGATNHVLGGNFAGTFTMNGFLDESRLSNEVVYTADFTPPSSAFTGTDTDIWLLHYDGADGSTTITNSAVPNTLTVDAEINAGWGRLTWGENGWGILGDVELTGQQLTSTLNSVTIDAQLNVGWGSDPWGTETWGQSGLIVPLTGIQATADLGTPSLSITGNTSVTGEAMTASLGSVDGFASFVATPSGIPMTMSVNFDPEIVDLNGISLSANLGTVVATPNTIAEVSTQVTSYWGSSTWGFGKWGNEPIETLAMNADEGTVDPGPDATVTGIGFGMAVATGTVISGTAEIDVTGITMTASLGQETIALNTPVDTTGIAMTATLSEESVVGDAIVQLTGFGLTMSLNSANALIWNEVNTGSAPIDPPGWQEVPTRAA